MPVSALCVFFFLLFCNWSRSALFILIRYYLALLPFLPLFITLPEYIDPFILFSFFRYAALEFYFSSHTIHSALDFFSSSAISFHSYASFGLYSARNDRFEWRRLKFCPRRNRWWRIAREVAIQDNLGMRRSKPARTIWTLLRGMLKILRCDVNDGK